MNYFDIEYSTYNKDNLHKMIDILLDDGYVCRLATEDNQLYILDAIATYDYSYKDNNDITHFNANRNETVFMKKWEFEENYCEVVKKEDIKENE